MTEQGAGVVRPLPGDGVVAHLNGLALVCGPGSAQVEELLDAVRETAENGGDGRTLVRKVAQVLARSMNDDPPTIAAAGPTGGGVAVLVSGAASAHLFGAPDGDFVVSGQDALTWADRLVAGPVGRVELRLPGSGPSSPYSRLDGGVVAGGGAEIDYTATGHTMHRPHPIPQPSPPPQPGHPYASQPSGPQQPMIPHQPPPPPGVPPYGQPSYDPPAPYDPPPVGGPMQPPPHPGPGPFGPPPGLPMGPPPMGAPQPPVAEPLPPQHDERRHDSGHFEPQPQPQPEPPADDPSDSTQMDAAPERLGPMVHGVDCKNDHFNDPRAPYCAVCGVPLSTRDLVPYKGPRPALGVLLLDDGMALTLDSDYILGRDPERAPEVQSGDARPARVTSPDGSVSRRHLRVTLENWDVNLIDLGSVNGTQIQPPGDPNFYDIPPNESVTIMPGTTVRVGVSRTMRFEPHRSA
ncbi:FHA domain-containing protein [Herbidospora sp. NEAU-GS84]|uniref:FHA domain-containing protein n=1 Tax=Herbidospora solisilvae TaxID=2696284 RepID=A0A7C9NAZ3_9ACTN|nr:FHA domain-containing protein [Herbidospora solisilvae]NAS26193.1 FHA domain-containing protein [Herbidospora solisilvae]